MKGERTAGALQYPAYLLVWSLGILFFTGGFYRADAALVSVLPIAFEPLASVPSLVTDSEFRVDLDAALSESEVMAGRWQPGRESVDKAVSPPLSEVRRSSAPVAGHAVSGIATVKSAERSSDREVNARPDETSSERAPVSGAVPEASMEKRAVSNSTPRVSEEVVALRREARKALNGGDSGRAFRVLMRNVRVAGNDKEYLALLAVAALEQRLPREALLVYEKLIKLDRLDSRWWMGLAVCQERLGADATAIYEEVVRLTEEGSDLQRLALDRLDTAPGVT
ncbi:MAG: hypothetical protein R3E82_18370 [Pseudomonadales bacterium]